MNGITTEKCTVDKYASAEFLKASEDAGRICLKRHGFRIDKSFAWLTAVHENGIVCFVYDFGKVWHLYPTPFRRFRYVVEKLDEEIAEAAAKRLTKKGSK